LNATIRYDTKGNILGYQGIIRNVTRQREEQEELRKYQRILTELVQERTRALEQAQEQLLRRERLAALGQLAGGMSHELRNPLAVIRNIVYILNNFLENPDSEVKEALVKLDKEVTRAERIITDVLNFTHPMPAIKDKVNIGDIIEAVLSNLSTPENIEVVCRLEGSLPLIVADPDKIELVFENLITNAFQAMPQGGQLKIAYKVQNSDWIAISIMDNGIGITSENLKNIFEPLFTTKSKGIGLGLTLVKTLIEEHGGFVEVQSKSGHGSVFTITLPVGNEKQAQNQKRKQHLINR
jgi:signal transduction histidine kinase